MPTQLLRKRAFREGFPAACQVAAAVDDHTLDPRQVAMKFEVLGLKVHGD